MFSGDVGFYVMVLFNFVCCVRFGEYFIINCEDRFNLYLIQIVMNDGLV